MNKFNWNRAFIVGVSLTMVYIVIVWGLLK